MVRTGTKFPYANPVICSCCQAKENKETELCSLQKTDNKQDSNKYSQNISLMQEFKEGQLNVVKAIDGKLLNIIMICREHSMMHIV